MGNERKICTECGGKMRKKIINRTFKTNGKEIIIKGIEAYVCDECGEEEFTLEEARMIERVLGAFRDKHDNQSILNLDETAELLRVSNQTVYNMIRDGRIKAYKAGREWRFLASDIQSYMNENRSTAGLLAAKGGKISKNDMNIIMQELKKRKKDE